MLNVHGGPWARDVWGYRPDVQWFTNRGYAVLQVLATLIQSTCTALYVHDLRCSEPADKALCAVQVNYRGSTGMLLCEQCDESPAYAGHRQG